MERKHQADNGAQGFKIETFGFESRPVKFNEMVINETRFVKSSLLDIECLTA